MSGDDLIVAVPWLIFAAGMAMIGWRLAAGSGPRSPPRAPSGTARRVPGRSAGHWGSRPGLCRLTAAPAASGAGWPGWRLPFRMPGGRCPRRAETGRKPGSRLRSASREDRLVPR
jgi:hypothetical protein